MPGASMFHHVRSVLLSDWDPLKVGGNPHLADEYAAVAPQVLDALKRGIGQAELARLLLALERDPGVPQPDARAGEAAAARLKTLDHAVEQRAGGSA
jgi:hypothetical protein